MGFNEKVHAYIAAKFYVHLTEAFGERGKAAFIHGTQYHASQRGRRMAQRAIRDGQPLTYETYCRYGEWVNTEEIKELGCANKTDIVSCAPDYTVHIHCCPWHTQFREMGLPEAGEVYCAHLDNSICRGFNPYISFTTLQSLHFHDCCIQTVKDANLDPQGDYSKRPEGLRSFEYHCANSYWSYAEVARAIFGAGGEQVAAKVLADFTADYGEEMADTLMRYRDTNFNITL